MGSQYLLNHFANIILQIKNKPILIEMFLPFFIPQRFDLRI